MNVESVRELETDGAYEYTDGGHVNGGDGSAIRLFWRPRVPHDTKMVDLYTGYRDRLFNVYVEGEPAGRCCHETL